MSNDAQQAVAANSSLYRNRLAAEHIRLLRLEPPSTECFFEIHPLQDAPAYVAISYTWRSSEVELGEPSDENFHRGRNDATAEPPYFLIVDGQNHRISRNIYDIVKRAQEYGTVEYLWIDSLCINQADPVERSAQVSMMGDIYHSAFDVAVWLGWDERGEFEMVMEVCKAIQAEYLRIADEANGQKFRVPAIPNLFEPATRARLGLSSLTNEAWLEFGRFWNRRWFHRAWVVQEAALADKPPLFFWGERELDTQLLYDVSFFLIDAETGLGDGRSANNFPILWPREWFRLRRRLGETLAKVNALKLMIYTPPEERRLNEGFWLKCNTLAGPESINGRQRTDCMRLWTHMLEIFRAFDATDPRDHVYATLGIIKQAALEHGLDMPELVVDYTKSVSEVYANAVKHIMEAGNCVNLLCLAQDPQTRNLHELPSWVPDFSAGTEMPILMTKSKRCKVMPRLYLLAQAHTNDSSPVFKIQDNLRVLSVKGLLLDEIVAVGESHDELTNAGLWEQTAQILLSRDRFAPTSHNESQIESLWRTMLANTSSDGEDIASVEMAAEFKAYMTVSLIWNLHHDPKHLDKLPSWKLLIEAERDKAAALSSVNPAIITFEEVLGLAAEAERLWAEIAAGGPPPEKTPIMSSAARFAFATETMFHRRVLLTRSGYLGIGPLSTQPGDLVWLMPDAPLPTIVRQREVDRLDSASTSTCRYSLLGETYLHGDPDFSTRKQNWQWIELE